MGGLFDGLSKTWGDFWDSITGQGQRKGLEKAAEKQVQAIDSATQAQVAAQLRAMEIYKQIMEKALAEGRYGVDTQKAMTEAGIAAQREMLDKSIAAQKDAEAKALAAQTAGSQAGLDTAKYLSDLQLSWGIPAQAARVAALQAMPYLMSALGLPAYQVPSSFSVQQMPRVDLARGVRAAEQQLAGGASSAAPDAAADVGQQAAMFGLTPTKTVYDFTASPAYRWQLQQMDEELARTAAARGLSDSAMQYIRSRGVQSLAASERDKAIANLASIVNFGLGGQHIPTSGGDSVTVAAGAGSNLAGIYNEAARLRGSAYDSAGRAIGGLYSGAAANAAQAGSGLASLYSGYGSALAGMEQGIGATRGQQFAALGQVYGGLQNAIASQPSMFSNLLRLGTAIYGLNSMSPYGYFGPKGSWSNPY